MGLIKAGIGALGSTLADQWKEFFYCDSLDKEVLVVKGQKQISGRSSNTKGSDNVISNGSGIAVADGQCMLIVEQGKVVEVCAEPGQFTYNSSTEPSVFAGSFGQSLIDTFKTIGKRFTYGGDTGKDQRVYYINTKELIDNKFGTPTPVPFRVVDRNIGLDLDTTVRCSGVYSYKIANPILFYTNVAGNVSDRYLRSELDSQLKNEFIGALWPAFGAISNMQIRPNQLPAHSETLTQAVNDALTKKWGELRGLAVVSIAMNPPSLPSDDEELIQQAQRSAVYRDPAMAAAALAGAQADAMKDAANNPSGATTGFMGLGMAMNAGGVNAQALYQLSAQQKATAPEAPKVPLSGGWICSCGAQNNGKFCVECGSPKPAEGWTCKCGAVNKGKFCPECGSKKPVGEPLYRCDKCGWEPADPKHPPKFCPECGDAFGDEDVR